MRTHATPQIARQGDPETLAETYLLACCDPNIYDKKLKSSLTLARLLLEAGAHPMVRIGSSAFSLERTSFGCYEVFWAKWIRFLRQYLESFSKSHSLPAFMKSLVTLEDVFDTTKALLAQDAHVNYQIEESKAYLTSYNANLTDFYDYVIVCQSTSAMLLLEECFGEYAEFQKFTTNVTRVFRRP